MMTERVARGFGLSGKLLLGFACVVAGAVPAVVGLVRAGQVYAQTAAAVPAQSIADTWQGTIHPGRDVRLALKIAKAADGTYSATLYNVDQGAPPMAAKSATFDGATVKISLNMLGTFDGKLSADGKTIDGNLSGGPTPMPLVLARATPDTAWAIPEPPKSMAADADPSFEVATIKPNNSGATSMQGLTLRGRDFATRNSSLGDLISFAYNVQTKQIVGGPDWMDKDRYDILAVPDKEGVPSADQLRSMIKKLLKERFALTFRHDKRDLSAYVLTVGKSGNKLTPNQSKGPLPGLGFRPGPGGLTMGAINATMEDFTGFMQILVLDRPVVDQTGLTGKYDFQFTFTPDDSQFNGHPPKLPEQTDTAAAVAASPGLFEAIQQQLGLKLDAAKTAVDVIAIDHVEKPSAN